MNYIARIDTTSKVFYYLFNGHGDVVQTVTEAGVIENQYDYDIFGNPILTLETEYKNAIRYAGEFFDEESGLYYLRARYYNPYTGRFITEDSYWGEDNNPLSLNRYAYAHNNPIAFIDPTGHAPEPSANDRRSILAAAIIAALTGKTSKDEFEPILEQTNKIVEENNNGNTSSSRSGSSGSTSSQSEIPQWLDWDRDGVVDRKDDYSSFDKNGNSIADWLETETDQNWTYNSGTGWDDVSTLDPEQVHGPSAEDIRNFVDYKASSSSEAAKDLFNNWGTPNYEAFNYIARSVEYAMSNPYSDRKKDSDRPVSIAGTDFKNLYPWNTYDFSDYPGGNFSIYYEMWEEENANDTIIERLKSSPNNINYKKLLEIIEKHGITDFTYKVFESILDSKTSGTLESTNYILGNNFKYLAEYKGVSSYANFYVLMVEGEITLIRVGRDKTQVGFYDITKTDFFSQEFDGRNASSIFDDYLPTTGLDTNLNNSSKLSNDNYKFYENKATNTAEIFWKHLKSNSNVMKELARGLDTIRGEQDGTGIAKDFGEVYKETEYYPEKNNSFVLGEIYGHADGLNDYNWFRVAGKNKYKLWIADVENPNTAPTGIYERKKQNKQNERWKKYGEGR